MIDTKKFHDELIDLWNNFYNTDEVYDIIFVEDDYIEVKCENKRIANEFADFIMAYYKATICYDFRKGNGCYQFSISPSLMIRESKKSIKESIPFTKITWYDDFPSQEMANLIVDKFDVSVSYFSDFDEGVYGIRIKTFDYNSKILNFIKKKVDDVSVLEESKKSARKSIKESSDDNWYKLKMLNEMLDAMEEDEYNIPKVGIYGVTKNINLDEGAIRALIKYYK